ncbi:MAG TPA: hypothetical protein PKA66_10045 [Gemmatimonadales bacterium]|nr:hypothetical protein [Gemmatimonadales bacterium]
MNRILAILTLAVLVPSIAAAQKPQTRDGFGISFGFGAGAANFCDDCEELADTELSGYLRLGGYLNPSLFLAAESNGWVGSTTDYDAPSLGAVMGVVQWYPMVAKGLYLKAGFGYSYASVYSDFSTSGVAGSIGAGYDIRLARNFALTPYVNYLSQFGGGYSYSGSSEIVADAAVHLFQFGLGFTWF